MKIIIMLLSIVSFGANAALFSSNLYNVTCYMSRSVTITYENVRVNTNSRHTYLISVRGDNGRDKEIRIPVSRCIVEEVK